MVEPGSLPIPEEVGSEWTALIQQQVQNVLQAAIPHIVQQITDQVAARPRSGSPLNSNLGADRVGQGMGMGRHNTFENGSRESKVAEPEKFSGKKGNEVYRWFAQIRLVFRGKPRTYHSDADKVAFALSYMAGAAQNWAMPLLQALDEGRNHELLENYDAFREAVIGVYGDIDRRGNAEDRLARLRQTGSVATYISTFNEYAAQIDWNESSLVARFRGGLKDDILDSVATAETQPRRLHEWVAMASRIDERLWGRRQSRRLPADTSNVKPSIFPSRDLVGRLQSNPVTSGPVPMELGAIRGAPALAKTAAERLEYQRHGRCWGCGELGHVRAKCPTNPSRPLSIAATTESGSSASGKGVARD